MWTFNGPLPQMPPMPPIAHPSADPADLPTAEAAPALRRKLGLLTLLATLMVALPLMQVLRFQASEEKTLRWQRTRLDAIGHATEVHRGLLAHAEVALLVLRGRPALERERRERQALLDDRLRVLEAALAQGRLETALREAEGLREDWRTLAQRVRERRIGAADCQTGHTQLVEQALQVRDLVPRPESVAGGANVQVAELDARLFASRAAIDHRLVELRAERAGLLLALVALAAGAALLLRSVLRGLASAVVPPPGAAQAAARRRSTDAAAPPRAAGELMRRLRNGKPEKPELPDPAQANTRGLTTVRRGNR